MFYKLKNQLPPASLLAAGLLTITLLTALSGLWHYSHELAAQPTVNITGATAQRTAAGVFSKNGGLTSASGAANTNTGNIPAKSYSTGASSPRVVTNLGGASSNTSTAPTADNNQPASSAAQPTNISVALSVNGSGKGQVKLVSGSNQCDVLTQALAEGVISSLDMRYDSQYSSEAVYVIDGIGDPGTVNWTYAVNGSLPPYGCSLVTAHNGDSVNWQYQ